VDYDGVVASTVFTGGCNFRCGFCHNSALVLDYKNIQTIDENEILEYLKKRKGIIEGLCITGGEPTLNYDLPLFIEKVKSLGVLVKLDTNGTNPTMVKDLAKSGLVDYFAMDVKNDFDNYSKIIGIDNYDVKKVKDTAEFFLSNDYNYEFRTTLIKEFHNIENIEKIGQTIKGAKKYFLQKFKNGENCILTHFSPVEDEIALNFRDILKKYIPNVALRGYGI
jgi:pyruvate formate lyase activating enzyme